MSYVLELVMTVDVVMSVVMVPGGMLMLSTVMVDAGTMVAVSVAVVASGLRASAP